MPVNPQFLAARARERMHRDLAHLRAVAWLPLRRRGVIVTRTPLVPFTLRHRLEFRLSGNAFFRPATPILLGDVFLFLWRLHPLYRAPRHGREAFVARPAGSRASFLRVLFALTSCRSALTHRRLARQVRRCDLFAAVNSIREFLSISAQDLPSASDDFVTAPAAPDHCAADNQADWLMTTYRMSHDEALDLPEALSNQLYRERTLARPDGDLDVIAPSDSLLFSK